jgi:hypothetical protein
LGSDGSAAKQQRADKHADGTCNRGIRLQISINSCPGFEERSRVPRFMDRGRCAKCKPMRQRVR